MASLSCWHAWRTCLTSWHGVTVSLGLFTVRFCEGAMYFLLGISRNRGKGWQQSLGDQSVYRERTWIMFWHPCFGASLGHALEIFCSSPPTAGFLGMEPYSQCEACSWSLAISFLLLKPQFLVMGISPNVCTPSTIPKKQ